MSRKAGIAEQTEGSSLESRYSVEKSRLLYERAKKLIPGGVNSGIRASPEFITPGLYPMFVEKGKGSHLYDVDGNKYVDYVLGYGPIILGHAHRKVNDAVIEQLEKGTVYGWTHENEVKLAEMLPEIIPCADMVRFVSTGTEAIIAAVRIARAYTGKDKLAKFDLAYDGWGDEVLVGAAGGFPINYSKTAPPGVPKNVLENVVVLPWNNLDAVEKILKRLADEIAVVMIEGGYCDGWIGPNAGFLEAISEIARDHEILLMFDEIKTGFRLALGGAQKRLGITPDLATFSKAMGNGFPIAAIVGRRQVMEPVANQSVLAGTFNGSPLSVAAAIATVTELKGKNMYEPFLESGKRLQEGMREAIKDTRTEAIVQGPETMFRIVFTGLEKITNSEELATVYEPVNKQRNRALGEQLARRGVWCHPDHAWFTSMAHTDDDLDKTINAVFDSLREIRKIN